MHIPDGFLDAKTLAASATFAGAGVLVALSRSRVSLPPSRVPLLGMTAAFIFAAQMINFPVLGGTSGHLIGSVLACVILGPSGAIIALTSVLLVQAFLFADGGILALGANVLNMGVAAPLVGYAFYRAVSRFAPGRRGQLFAAGVAAWCSIVVASVLCAGELAWSGTVHWQVVFPAMIGVHSLIGIGEALITVLVLSAIMSVRPVLLDWQLDARTPTVSFVIYGILLILVVVLFVLPFASTWPDGLEAVASRFGFSSKGLAQPLMSSPVAGYYIPGFTSPVLAAAAAGLLGAFVVAIAAYLLTAFVVSRSAAASRRTHS